MESNSQKQRFVYHTEGVCPPEIHFHIQKNISKKSVLLVEVVRVMLNW